MIERITLEPDPAMADLDEPEITLMWADDTSRSCRIDIPLGDPRNPLDDARLLAKYRSLARAAIGEAEADTLADLVSRMDDVRDVREILMLLKARDGGRANSSIRELE
jgi:2-methylcitrate dehydratase PrpD